MKTKIILVFLILCVLLSSCETKYEKYHWEITLEDGTTVVENFCNIYEKHVSCFDEPNFNLATQPDRVYYNVISMEKVPNE